VAAENSTRLSQYIDESQMLLPKSSVAFENEKDAKVCSTLHGAIFYISSCVHHMYAVCISCVQIFSPCQLLSLDDGGSKYYVRLKISPYGIMLLYSERMQVFGISMHIKDVYHVETIKEVP